MYIVTKRYVNLENKSNEQEIWKPIKINGVDYTGLYEISNYGRVKSLNWNKTKTTRILRPGLSKGYLTVVLSKKGKKHTYKVHRLVAIMFLPNPSNLKEVNHIDEIKTNNNVSNLQWCNDSYNHDYGTRNIRVSKTLLSKNKGKIL